MDSLHDATSLKLLPDIFASVEGRIVPDDGYVFVWMFSEELLHGYEYCFAVLLVGHLVEVASETLLVQEANVALVLLLAINLDDRSLTTFEPASPDDGFLLHLDLVHGKHFPVIPME